MARRSSKRVLFSDIFTVSLVSRFHIVLLVSIASSSKTIARLGHRGIAGGEKFVYDGIFFKLSTDPYKLYGGDQFAMKAAGKSLILCARAVH